MNVQASEGCGNPACREYILMLENRLRHYERVSNTRFTDDRLPCPSTPPLTIVEWTPESPSSQRTAPDPQASRIAHDYNSSTIDSFLDRIPTDEKQWQQKRESIGLKSAEGVLQAFNNMLLPQHDTIIRPRSCSPVTEKATHPRSSLSVPDKLSDYIGLRAVEAGEAISSAERAVAYATYGGLVFLGECCVALELGASKEKFNESTRVFLSKLRAHECKAEDQTLQKYRRVAIWAVEEMYKLYKVYYHRAFELFLLAPTMISAYDRLARSSRKEELGNRLLKLGENLPHVDLLKAEMQAALPLDPLFCIWVNFRRRLDMDCYPQLRQAFQSTLFPVEQYETWYQSIVDQKVEVRETTVLKPANKPRKRQRATSDSGKFRKIRRTEQLPREQNPRQPSVQTCDLDQTQSPATRGKIATPGVSVLCARQDAEATERETESTENAADWCVDTIATPCISEDRGEVAALTDSADRSRTEQGSISDGLIDAAHLETTSTWQDDDGNATFDGYNSTDPWENEVQISDFDQLLNIDWTCS